MFAIYRDCKKYHLALCLVHLIKKCDGLESVDVLLLLVWSIFDYSSVKQAENLPPLKILKTCTTHWLTRGETSIYIINPFKPLVAALDALFKDKKDLDAESMRDLLLDQQIIIMLLLFAEVLMPINIFCKFLQTRNL